MENNEVDDGCPRMLLNDDDGCREVLYPEL